MKEFFEDVIRVKADFERIQGSNYSQLKYNLQCLCALWFFIVASFFCKRFYKPVVLSENLFLSWGTYSFLFDRLEVNAVRVEFILGRKSYLNLVRYTNSRDIFKSFRYILSPYMQFYYLEYRALSTMIAAHNAKAVYTYSLLDRYMRYLDFYCNNYGIDFHIIQHGAITRYDLSFTHQCKTFYIVYPVDMKLLNTVVVAENYVVLDSERVLVFDVLADEKVGFATSPRFIKENVIIVEECLKLFGELIVYPHPRDSTDYTRYEGVICFQKNRHNNLRLLISHTSTLVLTYIKETNIDILSLELRGLVSDIVTSEQVKVHNNLNSLFLTLKGYA